MAFVVPNRPGGTQTRDIAAIIADFDAMAADYETGFSTYKDLGVERVALVPTGTVAGTYFLNNGGGSLGTIPVSFNGAPTAFYLDPADYASTGRTARIRIRGAIICNATVPGVTFTLSLVPVTAIGGTTGNTPTIASVGAATCSTVLTAAANATAKFDSGDVAFPVAGLFAVIVVPSGTTAAGSQLSIQGKLQFRQT